jgi:hypothetical protein
MKLKDCNKNDYVRIWCIGTKCWDNEIVKVIDHHNNFTKVQYKNGFVCTFVSNVDCQKISF